MLADFQHEGGCRVTGGAPSPKEVASACQDDLLDPFDALQDIWDISSAAFVLRTIGHRHTAPLGPDLDIDTTGSLIGTDGTRVKVVTENGTVYLMGMLYRKEADAIVQQARKVGGVQRIVKVFEYLD